MDQSNLINSLEYALIELKLELEQGALLVGQRSLCFWGSLSLRHLRVGTGRNFDLTCGVGGAEQVHLTGSSTDYRVCVAGDVLTLECAPRETIVRLHAARGPLNVAFNDGVVSMGELWRRVGQAQALMNLAGEPSATRIANVHSYVNTAPHVSGMDALPDGALLQLAGDQIVETVYAPSLVTPTVALNGPFSAYAAQQLGPALLLRRCCHGLSEVTYVVGSATLTFADGSLSSGDLARALTDSACTAQPQGAGTAAMPHITAVALSADLTPDASLPVHTAKAYQSSCLHVGHVIEVNVSLSQSVSIAGCPQLQLKVGGQKRNAHYLSGSGSDTLQFAYMVTEEDVSGVPDAGVRDLTTCARLDMDREIEVGPILPHGAVIQPLARETVAQPVVLDIDLDRLERVPLLSQAIGATPRHSRTSPTTCGRKAMHVEYSSWAVAWLSANTELLGAGEIVFVNDTSHIFSDSSLHSHTAEAP